MTGEADWVPINHHPSGCGIKSDKELHKGGLAAAVAAGKKDDLPGTEGQRDRTDGEARGAVRLMVCEDDLLAM